MKHIKRPSQEISTWSNLSGGICDSVQCGEFKRSSCSSSNRIMASSYTGNFRPDQHERLATFYVDKDRLIARWEWVSYIIRFWSNYWQRINTFLLASIISAQSVTRMKSLFYHLFVIYYIFCQACRSWNLNPVISGRHCRFIQRGWKKIKNLTILLVG